MAARSLIAFAVVIAVQALAGCEKPARSGVARDDHSAWQAAEAGAREARLRRKVEAGSLGLAQLSPGGVPVDARHLPPLPKPSAVRIPVPVLVAQSTASETPEQAPVPAAAVQPDPCDYKPVMSDAEISACSN